jgi:hypothetical protein
MRTEYNSRGHHKSILSSLHVILKLDIYCRGEERVSGAKARVGCLLIENTGRLRGLYASEVSKARLEALSRP